MLCGVLSHYGGHRKNSRENRKDFGLLNHMSTILIVEDEAKMRRLLELDLADAGLQTVSAPDAETAVEAMKAGASDYVLKPFSLAELRMVVQKELDVHRLREENRSLREALGKRYEHPNIVARSAKMQEVLALAE